jgi:DNA-binding transcriptional regulator YhcF (GntR family)
MPTYNPRPPSDDEIKWRHIKNELMHALADGYWQAGDQIPTEEQLVADYECSRTTVRKALDDLCNLGLLEARPALGTFVLPGAQERTRMLLQPDADVEFRKPSGPNGRPDGRTRVTIYPPADQVTFRLPGLGEAKQEGVNRTDLLAIVWRADGRREVYPALNLMIECKQQQPPFD